jgi:two-component system chemotaxis response regulator CheB
MARHLSVTKSPSHARRRHAELDPLDTPVSLTLRTVTPFANRLLAAGDGTLAVIPAGATPPYRPSADLLLATLAVVAGPRVIAVVLSGHGNDAATGASAVHRFGGAVIAADPATSTAPTMPKATVDRVTLTDHVTALDDIADLLVGLTVTGVPQPPPALT